VSTTPFLHLPLGLIGGETGPARVNPISLSRSTYTHDVLSPLFTDHAAGPRPVDGGGHRRRPFQRDQLPRLPRVLLCGPRDRGNRERYKYKYIFIYIYLCIYLVISIYTYKYIHIYIHTIDCLEFFYADPETEGIVSVIYL